MLRSFFVYQYRLWKTAFNVPSIQKRLLTFSQPIWGNKKMIHIKTKIKIPELAPSYINALRLLRKQNYDPQTYTRQTPFYGARKKNP